MQAILLYFSDFVTKYYWMFLYNLVIIAKIQNHEKQANIKAFSATWGTQGIINMKLNRVLDITENDQTYEEYFKSKDWTSFDKEQIKFNKETMYLCIF